MTTSTRFKQANQRRVIGTSFALLLPLLVGEAAQAAATSPGTDNSKVTAVVVYPDRAQVTRSVSVPCGERVTVHFAGLPPAADIASLRAQVSVGRIEGLRNEEHPRSEAYSKTVEELDTKIQKIELELQGLREQQARHDATQLVVGKLDEVTAALVSRELADATAPQLAAWDKALDTTTAARLQHVAEQARLQAAQRELQKQLDGVRRQRLLWQSASARRELSSDVLLSCPPGQTTQLELSYLVGGTSWSPAYEARLSETGDAVTLRSYATLSQATGEDWRGARLTLSTAIPRQNATPPELSPLRVYADSREPPRKVLVSRDEEQTHLEAPGGASDRPEPPSPNNRPQQKNQGLSVQFVLPSPAEVPGDGTPQRLLYAESVLRGAQKYRTVPKLMPFVFRVSSLVNDSGYPLLAGPLSAFRKGVFFARYDLPRVAAGERFTLTFGLELGLRVKRNIVQEYATDKNFLSTTRRYRYVYKLELENTLQQPYEVELSEHIPVSELTDVQVALDPQTSPGYELQPQDGILTWKLPLSPQSKRTVALHYYVDVPASYAQ